MPSRSVGRAGFTLLEVLAAAVILAMIYGVLAEQGVQGFVLEGDADRRLRASLVADRRLAELRAQMAQGLTPPLGAREEAEQEFRVRVAVKPFELPLETLLPAPPEGTGRPERRGGSPQPSLFAPPSRGQEPAVRTLEVEVAWEARGAVRSVRRTAFALDATVAGALLQQAGLEVAPEGLPGLPDAPGGGAPRTDR